ncbi:UNVERIFIED_CONTAM: hypothetical protein NCL1_43217 [Trichonephila clavipes]
MEIGSNFAGRVIGRGGWKIEEFQDESDARIRVLNESDANGRTAIRIIGPAEARDKAKLLIEEFIVDFSQVSIDKSSRSSNGAANNTNKIKHMITNQLIGIY